MNDMKDVVTGLIIGLIAGACFFTLLFVSVDTAKEYYECKQNPLQVKKKSILNLERTDTVDLAEK